MSKGNYYHYTSKENAQSIQREGVIRESDPNSRYAHFGQGTYVTRMPPSAGREQIVENNRQSTSNPATLDKHTHYVKMPAGYIDNRVERCNTDRDVYKHHGEIDLKGVPFTIGQVKKP